MEEKQENIIGKRIGIYDVIYECIYKSKDGHRLFHVKCSQCGWETDIQMHHIKYTKQCKHKNKFNQYIFDSNFSNHRIRDIYYKMLNRCYYKKDKDYKFYGNKGIKIYNNWLKNPKSFEEWALSNGYKDDLTIDRIDSFKDYCPENCRWVTILDNSKYKSTTKITTVDGISHTGREWAELLELGTNTINKMLKKYPETKVKEFISKRMKDKTICRHSYETWMEAYSL
jgi:hypothetical protein